MIRLTHNKYISEMFPTRRGPCHDLLSGNSVFFENNIFFSSVNIVDFFRKLFYFTFLIAMVFLYM